MKIKWLSNIFKTNNKLIWVVSLFSSDQNGLLTDSRVFSSKENAISWVRKYCKENFTDKKCRIISYRLRYDITIESNTFGEDAYWGEIIPINISCNIIDNFSV